MAGIVGLTKIVFPSAAKLIPLRHGKFVSYLEFWVQYSPLPCVCPVQTVVKSCSVHLKWISTYSRLGTAKCSDLYEITPLCFHPIGLGKVHCSWGIINEAMFSLEIIERAYGNKTTGELVSNWQKKKEERGKNVCGEAKLIRWHTVGGFLDCGVIAKGKRKIVS